MDPIDRDAACQKMTALYKEDCKIYGVPIPECFNSDRAIKALKELPSAEPEIIRCKDCAKWHTDCVSVAGKHGCDVFCDYTEPYNFCSWAERRVDETD